MASPPHSHTSIDPSADAYRLAGVDLAHADAAVGAAKEAAQRTRRPFVVGGIGGFSGGFKIPSGYDEPLLLAACDGVGTKLEVAAMVGDHTSIGVDLVAMSVNDILAQGGQPLVFLDYIAASVLEPTLIQQVLKGVADGCEAAACALVGGESAEMPGFYPEGRYELAGFCVGVAEEKQLLPKPNTMRAGDVLIGLRSSGLHSNGYSLVRKLCFHHDSLPPLDLNQPLSKEPPNTKGLTLGEQLLEPTRIYVKPVLHALSTFREAIHGLVHITGGGFQDNIPRVLPSHLGAIIDMQAWERPPLFKLLQDRGQLSIETMARTFNCGIGFVMVVAAAQASEIITCLREADSTLEPVCLGELCTLDTLPLEKEGVQESDPSTQPTLKVQLRC